MNEQSHELEPTESLVHRLRASIPGNPDEQQSHPAAGEIPYLFPQDAATIVHALDQAGIKSEPIVSKIETLYTEAEQNNTKRAWYQFVNTILMVVSTQLYIEQVNQGQTIAQSSGDFGSVMRADPTLPFFHRKRLETNIASNIITDTQLEPGTWPEHRVQEAQKTIELKQQSAAAELWVDASDIDLYFPEKSPQEIMEFQQEAHQTSLEKDRAYLQQKLAVERAYLEDLLRQEQS